MLAVHLGGLKESMAHSVSQSSEYALFLRLCFLLLLLTFLSGSSEPHSPRRGRTFSVRGFTFILLLLDHIVYVSVVAIVIAVVSLLLFIGDLSSHSSLPGLGDDLRLLHLAFFGQLGTLLDGVGRKDAKVGILF